MVERIIRISPDGNEIEFVYTDKLVGLKELGKMEALRVSDVVFNTEAQKWQVVFSPGSLPTDAAFEAEQLFFNTREEAIVYEIVWLETILLDKK